MNANFSFGEIVLLKSDASTTQSLFYKAIFAPQRLKQEDLEIALVLGQSHYKIIRSNNIYNALVVHTLNGQQFHVDPHDVIPCD